MSVRARGRVRRSHVFQMTTLALSMQAASLAIAQEQVPAADAVHHSLPVVTVSGSSGPESPTGPVRGFVAKQSQTATKTDTPIIDTPQSITVITRDRMELQGAQSVAQAAGYTAGVTTAGFANDNRTDTIKIRGTDSTQYLDGLLNAVGFYNNTRPDPYALERMEILKGPSGMMYGQGAVGGVVNLVSKRPQAEAAREIGVSFGNYNRKQIQADFTGPIDADGKWLYRFVAMARDSDASVDYVKDNRYFIAPSLTYRPTADTEFTLLANFQRDDSGSMIGFFPWRGTLIENPAGQIPQNFFVSEPDFDRYTAQQHALGYQFRHRFNETFQVRQNLRYSHSTVDYRSIYTTGFTGATHGWVPGSDTLLRRVVSWSQPTLNQLAIDTQGQADFRTGAFGHKLLVGFDYQNSEATGRTMVPGSGTAAPINVFNPVYGNYTMPNRFNDTPAAKQIQTGVYMQEQLEWNKWLLMLGLRYDWSRAAQDNTPSASRDDNELTKRFGLMYRSDFGLNPYISYAESFQGQAGFNVDNTAFKPLRGKQWEVGVKYQPLGKNMTLTAALYDMREENRKVAGVVNGQAGTVQVGEARTRGAELEALVSLGGLDLVAAYTFLNAKVIEGSAAEQGQRLASIPTNTASLWANYRFALFDVPGFLAGAGVRYNGPSTDGTGNNRVGGFTVFDAVVAYDRGPVRVSLNMNNVFGKQYVYSCISRGDCFFGTQRSIIGNVTYRF